MMEKVGMRREGHIVHNVFLRGEWRDSYLYAILEHQLPASSYDVSDVTHRGEAR